MFDYLIRFNKLAEHAITKDDPETIHITPINAITIQLLWKLS